MDRRQFLAAAAGGITGVVASARIASANNESGATPNGAKPAAKTAKKPVPADLSDYVWHNVREWGVEGRAFDDTENYYDRLPARAKGVVREEVWNLARHSTGMAAFFETDATDIAIRYSVLNTLLAMPHMPAPDRDHHGPHADEGTSRDPVSVSPRATRGITIGLLLVAPLWAALAALVYALTRWWN